MPCCGGIPTVPVAAVRFLPLGSPWLTPELLYGHGWTAVLVCGRVGTAGGYTGWGAGWVYRVGAIPGTQPVIGWALAIPIAQLGSTVSLQALQGPLGPSAHLQLPHP